MLNLRMSLKTGRTGTKEEKRKRREEGGEEGEGKDGAADGLFLTLLVIKASGITCSKVGQNPSVRHNVYMA